MNPRQILAENLTNLMKQRGWSDRQLSRETRGKVSARYIGILTNQGAAASIEVLETLARAFGLEGWHLLMPELEADSVKSGEIRRLLKNYHLASEAGREYVQRAVAWEAGETPAPGPRGRRLSRKEDDDERES